MNGVVCFRVFCDIPYTKYDSPALSCVMRIAQYDIRYTQYENGDGRNCPEAFPLSHRCRSTFSEEAL